MVYSHVIYDVHDAVMGVHACMHVALYGVCMCVVGVLCRRGCCVCMLLEQFILPKVCLNVGLQSWLGGQTGGVVLRLLRPQLVLSVALPQSS